MLEFTDNTTMVNNYRPVQPLYDRKVKYRFNETTEDTAAPTIAGAGIIDISVGLFSLMLLTALFGR